jgi:hypothetical protein
MTTEERLEKLEWEMEKGLAKLSKANEVKEEVRANKFTVVEGSSPSVGITGSPQNRVIKILTLPKIPNF